MIDYHNAKEESTGSGVEEGSFGSSKDKMSMPYESKGGQVSGM